eukprot:359384-Chlamydomonas_euryale.AAC.2
MNWVAWVAGKECKVAKEVTCAPNTSSRPGSQLHLHTYTPPHPASSVTWRCTGPQARLERSNCCCAMWCAAVPPRPAPAALAQDRLHVMEPAAAATTPTHGSHPDAKKNGRRGERKRGSVRACRQLHGMPLDWWNEAPQGRSTCLSKGHQAPPWRCGCDAVAATGAKGSHDLSKYLKHANTKCRMKEALARVLPKAARGPRTPPQPHGVARSLAAARRGIRPCPGAATRSDPQRRVRQLQRKPAEVALPEVTQDAVACALGVAKEQRGGDAMHKVLSGARRGVGRARVAPPQRGQPAAGARQRLTAHNERRRYERVRVRRLADVVAHRQPRRRDLVVECRRDDARRVEQVELAAEPHPPQHTRDTCFRGRLNNAALQQPVDERRLADVGEADDACSHGARLQAARRAPRVELVRDAQQRRLDRRHAGAVFAVGPEHGPRAAWRAGERGVPAARGCAVGEVALGAAERLVPCRLFPRGYHVGAVNDKDGRLRADPARQGRVRRGRNDACVTHLDDRVHHG